MLKINLFKFLPGVQSCFCLNLCLSYCCALLQSSIDKTAYQSQLRHFLFYPTYFHKDIHFESIDRMFFFKQSMVHASFKRTMYTLSISKGYLSVIEFFYFYCYRFEHVHPIKSETPNRKPQNCWVITMVPKQISFHDTV